MSVTISEGKITSISASENGGETNCYHSACNTLKPEALSAQSASISSVSGVIYSSAAFKSSLQAILTAAKASPRARPTSPHRMELVTINVITIDILHAVPRRTGLGRRG